VTTSFAHIDAVIGSLAKNAAEGSDYLRMLVDVFAPEFRSSKNMHLRNFYAIIPAMASIRVLAVYLFRLPFLIEVVRNL